MRILLQSKNRELVISLGHSLTQKNIAYFLEEKEQLDWSQETYGETLFMLWIENEDSYEEAKKELNELLTKSKHLRHTFEMARIAFPKKEKEKKQQPQGRKFPRFSSHPITSFFLVSLSLFFILSHYIPKNALAFSFSGSSYMYEACMSPLESTLFFDYPKTFQDHDRDLDLLQKNIIEHKIDKNELFLSVETLIDSTKRPYWKGMLSKPFQVTPMFEKIGKGEVWRLYTPIFLHASWLHFACNFFWTALLLTTFESLIKNKGSILALISWIALFSNTAQYLVSGPNFLGFSGVIAGIAGYLSTIDLKIVGLRVPPEFQIEKESLHFLKLFIFICAASSALFLGLHALFDIHIPLSIANTAHVTGWITGTFFGRRNILLTKRET